VPAGTPAPASGCTGMDAALEHKVQRFHALPRELRLQALLAQAKRFPELPPELAEARDRGLGRVEECQTPLYLWVGVEDGRVRIHADAPREAPTVRGFVGFLVEALDGADPAIVAELPEDLMERMGLAELLGVVRARGLGAIIRRIRRDVARAVEEKRAS
jgi:cysteine desulfuration protein SufE